LRVNIGVKIQCWTYFDITATGVKHNFNTGRLPFRANHGVCIDNQTQWEFARNQQRNWETLIQLVSLRSLPYDISNPEPIMHNNKKCWQFVFSVDDPAALAHDLEDLGALIQDCTDVPMLVGLTEDHPTSRVLQHGTNIEFKILEW
jgi:hypothetical protein